MRWKNSKLLLKMFERSSKTLSSFIKAKHQVNSRAESCTMVFCYQTQTLLPSSISKMYCDTITFPLLRNRSNYTIWKYSYC